MASFLDVLFILTGGPNGQGGALRAYLGDDDEAAYITMLAAYQFDMPRAMWDRLFYYVLD